MVTKVERVPVKPPAPLLECAARPPIPPADQVTLDTVALLLVDLDAAGEDCRAKLGAVRAFVAGE